MNECTYCSKLTLLFATFEETFWIKQLAPRPVPPRVMKGLNSNAWSSTTLVRGMHAVEDQPGGLLSSVKLEKDENLTAALAVPCHKVV